MAKKKSLLSKLGMMLAIVLVLLALTIGAVAAAVYFEVVDDEQVQWANETVGLYKLPLVG